MRQLCFLVIINCEIENYEEVGTLPRLFPIHLNDFKLSELPFGSVDIDNRYERLTNIK